MNKSTQNTVNTTISDSDPVSNVLKWVLLITAIDRLLWSDRLGTWAFWLYNAGIALWITLNFFPIGWSQLMDVYEHGFAHARSLEFYKTVVLWQWLRLPGDVIFSIGALLMAFDFVKKLEPFFPRLIGSKITEDQPIAVDEID